MGRILHKNCFGEFYTCLLVTTNAFCFGIEENRHAFPVKCCVLLCNVSKRADIHLCKIPNMCITYVQNFKAVALYKRFRERDNNHIVYSVLVHNI